MEETKDSGTWEYNGTTFKRCPNCKKGIPAEFTSHKKCGWNVTASGEVEKPKMQMSEENISQMATVIVQDSLNEAMDILKNVNKGEFVSMPDAIALCDQLRRTKICLKFGKME